MAQTGFLPVVTMVSRGFAFIDEKREGERKKGGNQEAEDGGVNRKRGMNAVKKQCIVEDSR